MPALPPVQRLQRLLPVNPEHLEAAGGAGGGEDSRGQPLIHTQPRLRESSVRSVPSMHTPQLPSSGAGLVWPELPGFRGVTGKYSTSPGKFHPCSSRPTSRRGIGRHRMQRSCCGLGSQRAAGWMGEAHGHGHQGSEGKLWSTGNSRVKCDGKGNLGGLGLHCTSTVQQEQTQVSKDLMY